VGEFKIVDLIKAQISNP